MKSLTPDKAGFLKVLAARIVPETGELDGAGQGRFFAIIDRALQERPPEVCICAQARFSRSKRHWLPI